MTSIAVLMTCHNRRNTTLTCLESLFHQELPENVSFEVYLVDDASTDGTAQAVKQQFPTVSIIEGNGSLYWCGGMRLAWIEATKHNYDFFLWLNDDTILLPDAITTLYDVFSSARDGLGIVVGSTFDPDTGAHTYGGYTQAKRKSLDFRPVRPSASIQACDTFNGNCVLISQAAFNKLGNISPEFTHAIGDTDYGLRAKRKNIPMRVAPKYVGKCSGNPLPSWLDTGLPLRRRIMNLNSPKGLPPKEWMIFCWRHTEWGSPFKLIKLYLRVLSPNTWDAIKKTFK